MAAGCLAATALVTPFTILGISPASATTGVSLSSAVGADGEGESHMMDPTPAPTQAAVHDHAAMPEPSSMASSPSEEPMHDMTPGDSAGHGGDPAAVTAPSDEQRKVVLAGFAAVNLLVLAGAGIMRRMGHGSRGQRRVKQGPTVTPRRSGTGTQDSADQA